MRIGGFLLSYLPGKDRQPLQLQGGGVVYIRVVEYSGFEFDALSEALDAVGADKANDEHVLNTHELPPLSRIQL